MDPDISVRTNLLSLYMEYLLEMEGKTPTEHGYSLYAEIEPSEFNKYFSNIEELEKEIWSYMLSTAIQTINLDPQYQQFSQNEKLLSLQFTFFENLTLNRAYFIKHLNMRKGLRQKINLFSRLKDDYSNYVGHTIDQNSLLSKGIDQISILKEICDRSQQEAFWLQFICLIDFWEKDESIDQEKTDVAIEKSVKAAMDILEAAPVRSVVDLGKFVWQERFSKSNDSI